MINEIIERYEDNVFIKFEGFDEARIGVYDKNSNVKLIYSEKKCINILSNTMSQEDAYEYFYYNVVNMYLGEQTPIICFDNFS